MTRVALLLEDNFEVAQSMMRLCETLGVVGVHAGTVADAIGVYEVDRFDVIVADYELPDGTGLDFLARISGADKVVTVLHSALNRTREVEASHLHVDHMILKGWGSIEKMIEVLRG